MSPQELQDVNSPKFFTPFRILTILGLILWVTYLGNCFYPFRQEYVTYPMMLYAIGILVSIIVGIRLIYLLVTSKTKLADYTGITLIIYYCILFVAYLVYLQVRHYT